MLNLSQDKKIAISAVVIFIVSFVSMLFFFSNLELDSLTGSHANVLGGHGAGHEEEHEAASSDPEEQYRAIIGDTYSDFVVTSTEGLVKHLSIGACDLVGNACKRIVGKSFFSFVNSEELPDLISAHSKVIHDGAKQEGAGPYRVAHNDEEVLVLFNIYPIVDSHGKVIDVIFVLKDLTEQVEALNEENAKDKEDEADDEWLKTIYPKVKDVEDLDDKLLVDLISFYTEDSYLP